MPLGLSQGIVTFMLAKVNYHWRKARWHALNAPGVTPRDAHATFE
jgi:hypothetical protein